eukprot:6171071-Alexandrium_andersonii.AAC.1
MSFSFKVGPRGPRGARGEFRVRPGRARRSCQTCLRREAREREGEKERALCAPPFRSAAQHTGWDPELIPARAPRGHFRPCLVTGRRHIIATGQGVL